jgi:hypothetical protein
MVPEDQIFFVAHQHDIAVVDLVAFLVVEPGELQQHVIFLEQLAFAALNTVEPYEKPGARIPCLKLDFPGFEFFHDADGGLADFRN